MRLSRPERATATFGRSALVAMDVAIAFAVSWNPLVKSNPRAVVNRPGPLWSPAGQGNYEAGVRTTVAVPVCGGVPVSV
jgi:hypothetical protein